MTCVACKKEIDDIAVFCQLCGKKQIRKPNGGKPRARGNGMGTVYRLPNGKYRAEYTVGWEKLPDGSSKRIYRTKSTFKTKREAYAYLPQLAQKTEKKKQITIAEAYAAIQPKLNKLSPKCQNRYKYAYKHILSIENCFIDDLVIADLQAIIDDIDGGYYSKRYVKDLFSKLFLYAYADGKAERNIVPHVELPMYKKSGKKVIFTKEEIASLWDAWNKGKEFAGYILILIYCGLRTGELFSIARRDKKRYGHTRPYINYSTD